MSLIVIAPDTVVTFSYVLYDERGEAVDRMPPDNPMTYVHGYAQIVPGLERQIEGLAAGAKGSFAVDPEEAFGEHDEDAVFSVGRDDFPESGAVAVGDEYVAEGPDGEPMPMRVLEVNGDDVLVDTNHPLAGQKIRFEVEVASVRPATEEEICAAQDEIEKLAAEAHEEGCGCGEDHDLSKETRRA